MNGRIGKSSEAPIVDFVEMRILLRPLLTEIQRGNELWKSLLILLNCFAVISGLLNKSRKVHRPIL